MLCNPLSLSSIFMGRETAWRSAINNTGAIVRSGFTYNTIVILICDYYPGQKRYTDSRGNRKDAREAEKTTMVIPRAAWLGPRSG